MAVARVRMARRRSRPRRHLISMRWRAPVSSGLAQTVPEGAEPSSAAACTSILGYDPVADLRGQGRDRGREHGHRAGTRRSRPAPEPCPHRGRRDGQLLVRPHHHGRVPRDRVRSCRRRSTTTRSACIRASPIGISWLSRARPRCLRVSTRHRTISRTSRHRRTCRAARAARCCERTCFARAKCCVSSRPT